MLRTARYKKFGVAAGDPKRQIGRMDAALDTLTDKEKETLRLIVRGHDAKSAASALDLSVHTINERLRSARRKLDVTSSREAARLLLESEGAATDTDPENLGYKHLGDAETPPNADPSSVTAQPDHRAVWIGGIAMITALTLALALAAPGPFGAVEPDDDQRAAAIAAADAEREAAARQWLALVDRSDWEASHAATASSFRAANTVALWEQASQQVRAPLGAVLSRRLVSVQIVPSDEGYEAVRFETDFEHRKGVIESLTLRREDGVLRVSGYYID